MNTFTSRTHASPESRLFRAYWGDGLVDLLFGIGALAVGVLWAVDQVVFGAIVPAFVALSWAPLRRALVESRAGWVEFSQARTASNRRNLAAATLLGLGILALLLAIVVGSRAGGDLVPGELAAGLPAALIGLMAVLIGGGLMLGRFLAYGAAFALAGLGVGLAGAEPAVAILAGGVVTALSGAWLLARFLRGPAPIDEG